MTVAFADGPTHNGSSLADYLDSLTQQGLRIIYSSDLVSPDQMLLQEPDPSDPKSILAELLRTYGLKAVDGPSGSLLIIREATSRTETELALSFFQYLRVVAGKLRDVPAERLADRGAAAAIGRDLLWRVAISRHIQGTTYFVVFGDSHDGRRGW